MIDYRYPQTGITHIKRNDEPANLADRDDVERRG